MKIFKAYKFRIYPNKIQKEIFEKYFGVCRLVYNSVLDYKIKIYKKGIKYSAYDAIKDFTEIKKIEGYEWLREINAQTIQQEILNLDNAFQKFFKEKKTGFPKFKSKKNDSNSFRVPQFCKIDFENRKIKIPKLDQIKFRDGRIFNSKIRSITISKNKCNQYFASMVVEEEIEQRFNLYLEESKIFSADMSCKNFLVSQEMEFENQKFYRKNERRLKIRQRKFSKKKLGSHNFKKEKLILAKIYLNITNQRRGYQGNISDFLVKKFDALIFEDLNIDGMKQFNKGISKTITLDFSFSEFLTNLEWKCFKNSKYFVKIDRWFPSSRLCSECGQIKKDLKLSDRVYKCDCGLEINRDLNAAKNIKSVGINVLKEKGINLLKQTASIKNSTEVKLFSESYALKDMIGDLSTISSGRYNSLRLC